MFSRIIIFAYVGLFSTISFARSTEFCKSIREIEINHNSVKLLKNTEVAKNHPDYQMLKSSYNLFYERLLLRMSTGNLDKFVTDIEDCGSEKIVLNEFKNIHLENLGVSAETIKCQLIDKLSDEDTSWNNYIEGVSAAAFPISFFGALIAGTGGASAEAVALPLLFIAAVSGVTLGVNQLSYLPPKIEDWGLQFFGGDDYKEIQKMAAAITDIRMGQIVNNQEPTISRDGHCSRLGTIIPAQISSSTLEKSRVQAEDPANENKTVSRK